MNIAILNLSFKKEGTVNTDHGDPEDYVLINEAVEVLVEEEEAGAYEGCVREVQLTLGHVCDLQRHRDTHEGKKTLSKYTLCTE